MAVFKDAQELKKHVMEKLWNDSAVCTAQKSDFPNSTPMANRRKSATNTLFTETITDANRKKMYDRGIGGPIVDKLIDDALKNGFVIDKFLTKEEPDRELTEKLVQLYESKVRAEFDKAWKWSRLYGFSVLLLGIKDNKELNEPADSTSKVEYIIAIPETWVQDVVYETADKDSFVTFPLKIKQFRLLTDRFGTSALIDVSRVIIIENPGLQEYWGDRQNRWGIGVSALDRPYNIITIVENMLWSAGQTMWRVGGGLLGIDMPPDANEEDREAALDSLGDINAKTVLAFPDGYKANILNTASAVLNPAPYFEKMMEQLAGVTEYPKTILYGLSTGAVTGSQLDRSTYYSKIVAKQNAISGVLKTVLMRLSGDTGEWSIRWNSPYEMTEAERLGALKLQAQIDTEKVKSFTRTPDEIRERDGLPKLTAEQTTLLQIIHKASSTPEPMGTAKSSRPTEANPQTKLTT
jgi:phage-related protein (TIGR01555 family)